MALSAAVEQIVAEDEQKDNQEDSEKTAVYKKHDRHTDSNPEQDEADHPFHGWLLYLS